MIEPCPSCGCPGERYDGHACEDYDPLAVVTPDAWVTSDQHWSHPNIRRYQDRPMEHFELMRKRWLELVGERDVVLHLGDLVCFGDRAVHPEHVRGLPGRKLLLLGNHDDHSIEWYEDAGFTVLGRKPMLWVAPDGTRVAFSHEPIDPFFPQRNVGWLWDVNVHGHVHGKQPASYGTRRNVSVEVCDYAPVRLRDVLRA